MNGLESRLQAVDGVEAIELELGEEGLEGITVRLAEGADEGMVLEGVRRLLVAYGTKVPRQAPAATTGSDLTHPPSSSDDLVDDAAGNGGREATDDAQEVAEVTEGEVATGTAPDGEEIRLAVTPGADATTALVTLIKGGRVVRRQIPASPRAIVQAVIDAGAEVTGREPISVMGLNVSSVDHMRILTVIAGDHGTSPKVCTASVVERDWPTALMDVLMQVLAHH